MKKLLTLISALCLMGSAVAFAGDQEDGHGRDRDRCRGEKCEVPTKKVCFNIVCSYEDMGRRLDGSGDQRDHDRKECRAAATFVKEVTVDGGEVVDDSDFRDNARLEVSCNGTTVFDGPARRFTDLLGTRLQGEAGPFPAISLPRGALHGGGDKDSGYHIASSRLEVILGHDLEKMHGKCSIWTGNP